MKTMRQRDKSLVLSELVDSVPARAARGPLDLPIKGIKSDSRAVEKGDLFVAVRGRSTDGHRFVEDAVHRGAVAVVTEEDVNLPAVTAVIVQDTARALALIASRFHGDPSRDLYMVGVTGTNGKTSTTNLLRAICEESSWGKMGLIGTLGHGAEKRLEASVHTTPEPITLHRLLGEMKSRKCFGVVMEVSSHAVRQQRIWGLEFDIGMLTNVTRDHLDYHSSFDDYVDAKREFCYSLVAPGRRKPAGKLVYSLDNELARDIGAGFRGHKLSTSMQSDADVFADAIDATLEGTRFTLHLPDGGTERVSMKLLGAFSVANALTAAAAAHAIGIGAKAIKAGIESLERVPGRFDPLGGGDLPVVIVDYSHTPDSLERTLRFCLGLKPRRLIAVFGCGGDRDRGKRPLMGAIAERYSDVCYVTSDNPRSEDPKSIIDEILTGMDARKPSLRVEIDRRRAIEKAIAEAEAGDIVAVCGKGHEDYQIIGTTRVHFDDREEAQRALDRRVKSR